MRAHTTKSLAGMLAFLVVLVGLPGALSAQWPNYPTPGVPKGPDGKPDLTGPAPRTADGKPDLSGIWEFVRNRPALPSNATQGAPPPTPADAGRIGLEQFFNIGWTLKDGLPFTPWGKELRARRFGENSRDNPDAHCLPLGLMQLHTHPQPRKMIQTSKLMVILYEAQAGVRQIFMDGRPLPNNDPQPWWYGYSIGHWDGDTLVVESAGFRDDVWLDLEGSPLTGAGKMTERFRRVNYGNLEIEITVEDPKAYTKPWTATVKQRVMLDTDLIEFICGENEKSDTHLVGK
jgi:hypothetical protein